MLIYVNIFISGKRCVKALDGVNLTIYKGEIIGLLGVNGAGKTTLSSILASLHQVTSGDVLIDGKSIYQNMCDYRLMIGYCPQKMNLDPDLTVEQNLRFAGRYMGMSEELINERLESFIKSYNLERYQR